MNFNSGAFLIFLPVVVGLYWLLPHKFRKYWLLAASCFFYMYWNPLLILLLMLSTCIDYFCGRGMARFRDNKARRKTLLMVSICMNLGMLFFFKYLGFFSDTLNSLFHLTSIPVEISVPSLILPVGISFYTFQTMSYSIDVYRGDAEPERDFISFALYVSFFPQLVAGPIENPRNLLPQLKKEQRLSSSDLTIGFRLLLCGFFRKCVVADLCGIYVNSVFSTLETAGSLSVALAGSLFLFQMYCDFGGYSLIAAGAARLMGVRLMRNFNQPYLSQNYTEMFQRWHISLNQWFTRYVYIPLGGSRHGLWIRIRNTLIVFSLCGLWHGARWTYVLWGLYAAFFVCLESILRKPAAKAAEKYRIPLGHPAVILFRRLYMFIIYIPAALFFRAESLEQIKLLLQRLFSFTGTLQSTMQDLSLTGPSLINLVIVLIAMACLPALESFDPSPEAAPALSARRIVRGVYLVLIIALAWLSLLATQDAAGFAYFQF